VASHGDLDAELAVNWIISWSAVAGPFTQRIIVALIFIPAIVDLGFAAITAG
jgi:hypothetical protein